MRPQDHDFRREAEEALSNATAFGAVAVALEAGTIHGEAARAEARRIADMCKFEQLRQLEKHHVAIAQMTRAMAAGEDLRGASEG